MPYEVACACGQPVRGRRDWQHQAVRCPVCGRRVFVLPISPLLYPNGAKPPRRRHGPGWALPVVAGVVALAAVVAGFGLLLPRLPRTPSGPTAVEAPAAALRAHLEAGRQALTEGMFHQAAREFAAAAALRDAHAELAAAPEARGLTQLRRQADLLADLLGKSLQEIVQEAGLVRDEGEWQARFRKDYQGKAVLFDDEVRRDAVGRPALAFYVVMAGDQAARLALEDVTLLNGLPLDPPPRLVFGVRLAAVTRGPGGGWVVRFQPDSGVLLTDRDAALGLYPAPLDDMLLGVLQRQAEWLGR